jgi:hypothetical protein
MSRNSKVAKIHPELDIVRNMFNSNLSDKLGVENFPKNKSDLILANTIRQNGLLDFDVNVQSKQRNKKIGVFDIKWR